MEQIERDIQNKDFRRVYLIYGPEDYLRRQAKKAFQEALSQGDSLNYTYREGGEAEEDEIRLLMGTVPFMAEKRLILLENTGWFKKAGAGLARELPELPDSTVLVFVEQEVDKRNALFKAVQETGRCVLCEAPKAKDLMRSLKASFRSEGYQIEESALELFLERCGSDMNTIKQEMEKLLSYTWDTKKIRREDVAAVTHQTLQDRLFDMVDAMAAGRPKEAFRFLEDMLALKLPPVQILAMITQHTGRLFALRELKDKGLSPKAVEEETKWHPYVVKKGLGQCGIFSSGEWKKKWERCLDYDYAIKSGRMTDRIALEMALWEMSER